MRGNSNLQSRVGNIAVAALSTLLVLLIAEGGVRTVRRYRSSEQVTSGPGALYVKTESGRRLRPNAAITIKNHAVSGLDVEIRTNSLGLRGPEPSFDGRPRLFVLGDSITFADYLPWQDGIVHLLGQRLDMQALNGGIGGIDLAAEVAFLEETAEEVRPDLVLIAMFVNDCRPSPVIEPLPAWLGWSQLADFVDQRLAWIEVARNAKGLDTDVDWRAGPVELRRWAAARPGLGAAWTAECWADLERELEAARRLATTHGFALAAAYFPLRQQVEATFLEDGPQREFSRVTEAVGIRSRDLLPALRLRYHGGGEPKLFFDHAHPTREGYEAVLPVLTDLAREALTDR